MDTWKEVASSGCYTRCDSLLFKLLFVIRKSGECPHVTNEMVEPDLAQGWFE